MRRKARVTEKLEKLSVADGLRAVKFAEIVVLLIDATSPFDKQDVQLADLVEREGRALIIGINKWDLKLDRQEVRQTVNDTLLRALPKLRGVPVIMLSAETGRGVDSSCRPSFGNMGCGMPESVRPSSIIGCRV